MGTAGKILQEIHRLRRHIQDLDERIAEGPRLLKARQNAQTKQQDAVSQHQDSLKHLKAHILEKEGAIKAAQQHIEKLEKSDISSKKEWDALKVEIAQAKESIRKLEDDILETMGKLEEQTQRLPAAEKQAAQAREAAAAFEKEHAGNLQRFAEEKQKAQAELAEVEKQLPPEFLPQYQRLVSVKSDDAFAAVHGKVCTACYTEVTAQMVHELTRGHFFLCKNCDRMLYLVG